MLKLRKLHGGWRVHWLGPNGWQPGKKFEQKKDAKDYARLTMQRGYPGFTDFKVLKAER